MRIPNRSSYLARVQLNRILLLVAYGQMAGIYSPFWALTHSLMHSAMDWNRMEEDKSFNGGRVTT